MRVETQLSAFIENKAGTLAALAGDVAKHGISIRAFTIATLADHAVVRLVVSDPHRAMHLLGERGVLVVTSAVLAKAAAAPMLRAVLEDPFWRVRAAAVRALLALGEDDVLERLAPATSERSAGALSYIARRLGAKSRAAEAIDVPNAIVARLDPDPAVVTARIERGDAVYHG